MKIQADCFRICQDFQVDILKKRKDHFLKNPQKAIWEKSTLNKKNKHWLKDRQITETEVSKNQMN